jgi:hypothetical protein
VPNSQFTYAIFIRPCCYLYLHGIPVKVGGEDTRIVEVTGPMEEILEVLEVHVMAIPVVLAVYLVVMPARPAPACITEATSPSPHTIRSDNIFQWFRSISFTLARDVYNISYSALLLGSTGVIRHYSHFLAILGPRQKSSFPIWILSLVQVPIISRAQNPKAQRLSK